MQVNYKNLGSNHILGKKLSFSFETTFVLDKAFYQECYDQSANKLTGLKAYIKAIFLLILGFATSAFGQLGHLSMFIIVLSIVEAMSIYWQQTWWVWRQLISKESNSQVTLNIDEQGIKTKTTYHQLELNWSIIHKIELTEKGGIFHYDKGRYYLSFSYLSESAIDYVKSHIE